MAEFRKTCHVTEIPEGKAKVVTLEGQDIGLFKIDGKVYACSNFCPHRGGPLSEGTLDGTVVTCPFHHWRFDVSTGKSPVHESVSVAIFSTKLQNDEIWVEV